MRKRERREGLDDGKTRWVAKLKVDLAPKLEGVKRVKLPPHLPNIITCVVGDTPSFRTRSLKLKEAGINGFGTMHLDKGVCEYRHTTNMTRGWLVGCWLASLCWPR